jgi:hypothetical protein
MNIWDPFHPLAYFLHTGLGVAGILGAIVAMAAVKGTKPHILAGRIFAVAAGVAAATAIAFSFTSFAPMAIASAVIMFSVVGSAILAHRRRSSWVTKGELLTTILMALALLWLLYGIALSVPQGGLLWIPPLVFAALCAAFLVNDIHFLMLDDAGRSSKRLARHFSRMGFAFALAIHQPLVIFADDLHIHPGLAYYGTLFIWPLIFFFFDRRIKKRGTIG